MVETYQIDSWLMGLDLNLSCVFQIMKLEWLRIYSDIKQVVRGLQIWNKAGQINAREHPIAVMDSENQHMNKGWKEEKLD